MSEKTQPPTSVDTTDPASSPKDGPDPSSAAPPSVGATAPPPAAPPRADGKKPFRVKNNKLDFRGQKLKRGATVFLTDEEFALFPSHFVRAEDFKE